MSCNEKHNPLIRWKLFLILLGVSVLSVGYISLVIDSFVKSKIEYVASAINGAQVNISRLTISLLKPKVVLEGIEIAHYVRPMRNLFTINRIEFNYDFEMLFRKKLHVNHMKIEGIHYLTPRKDSGVLSTDVRVFSQFPGLLDRVSSGFYKEIRSELNNNPLRYLGQLSTGLDLKSIVRDHQVEINIDKELQQFRDRLNGSLENWEKEFYAASTSVDMMKWRKVLLGNDPTRLPASTFPGESLKNLRRDIVERKALLENKLTDFDSRSETLASELKTIEKGISKDVSHLRKKLGWPDDFSDLTTAVFGPKLVGYFERMSYWIDWARRKMPRGSGNFVQQPKDRGVSIHFLNKNSPAPAFIIKQGEIVSDLENETGGAKVRGEFSGFTIDPSIYGHPFQFHVEADVPSREIESAHCSIVIDHTKDKYSENVQINIQSWPLDDWKFYESTDLKLTASKARMTLKLDSQFLDNNLKTSWNASLRDVDYRAQSQFQRMADLIKDILLPVYTFEMNGSLEGPFDKLKFNISSELGKKLASGLISEFRHQIGAIDDILLQLLLDNVEPIKRELKTKIAESKDKVYRRVKTEIEDLRALFEITERLTRRSNRTSTAPTDKNLTSPSF